MNNRRQRIKDAKSCANIAMNDAIRAIAAGRRDDTAKAFARYTAWVGRETELSNRLNSEDRVAAERV